MTPFMPQLQRIFFKLVLENETSTMSCKCLKVFISLQSRMDTVVTQLITILKICEIEVIFQIYEEILKTVLNRVIKLTETSLKSLQLVQLQVNKLGIL